MANRYNLGRVLRRRPMSALGSSIPRIEISCSVSAKRDPRMSYTTFPNAAKTILVLTIIATVFLRHLSNIPIIGVGPSFIEKMALHTLNLREMSYCKYTKYL